MRFIIFLVLLFFWNIFITFAYIDPGTGGYLLSSLWASIVGFFAVILAFILRFFRYTLKRVIFKYKKVSFILLFSVILVLSFFIYSYFFIEKSLFTPYDSNSSGVHSYNKNLSYNGYNLYNGKLIDMNGEIIREWNYSYLSVLDEEGNYYAQRDYETLEWGKFDFNDNPIWIKDIPIHHEIYLTPNDTIITFTKEAFRYKNRLVEFDVILEFDKDGNEIGRYSLYENLEMFQQFHRKLVLDNPFSILPENHKKNTSIWGANHDYYHLNSISFVPSNIKEDVHEAFQPGNWILSFRHGSMIFILDKDTKEVLWKMTQFDIEDNLEGQHSPQMLENGNILIFDNGRYRKWSRVIELNPINMNIEWEYKNDNFFTLSQGYVQKLDNGNLLITQSEDGRVFEITKDKEIVWEFYEPNFKENDDDVLVREGIYRMTRYEKDFIDNLLE